MKPPQGVTTHGLRTSVLWVLANTDLFFSSLPLRVTGALLVPIVWSFLECHTVRTIQYANFQSGFFTQRVTAGASSSVRADAPFFFMLKTTLPSGCGSCSSCFWFVTTMGITSRNTHEQILCACMFSIDSGNDCSDISFLF